MAEDATDAPPDDGDDGPVYASEVEGRQYRGTWYCPLPYDDLDRAPETDDYPDRGSGGAFRLAELPRVPRLRDVVGPSAIMLGASLGSGETLFWPGLIARHGWGLYWAFVVGILTQFVVNTELQRWTLATGESVFRSYVRVHRAWPWAFLLAGLLSLGWPGWAAGAAQVVATAAGLAGSTLLGLPAWKPLAVGLLLVVWLSYQVSSVAYNAVEAVQVGLLLVALVTALSLAVVSGAILELDSIPTAVAGIGTLPAQMDVAVFLGGLAFAGAGGYLNLSQSLWVREKGYGMGNYQGRVRNPLSGDDPEPIRPDGFTFRPTRLNLKRWRGWWRVTRAEHFLTFVVGLLGVATVLMAVAHRHAPGTSTNALEMWLGEIAPALGGLGGVLVFVLLFVALFTTEYAIVESFVRNSADAIYETFARDAGWDLSRLFWWLLTAFTLWGVVIIVLFTTPLGTQGPFFLLVVGAALSGMMMWPYTILTLLVNTERLPEHLQPSWGRVVAMWWAAGFYGFFSVLLLGETATMVGLDALDTAVTVAGSAPGGYVIWIGYALVQGYAVVRSVRAKRTASGTVDALSALD
ncbi:Mn2+ and Fe2+ transporters of the NRAMP family [Haloplanus vescus]|uniref:Mn2+ and Fe2+ transporters of the NRAMP family n=1 Tax=Haloplanus vescus TaxID=555874 RepID=A0A1H3Y7U7_9EURY|nr:Nramp family divalent metal transporter [Haloplanus vescus]SEA07600.1 Mn2+ and Fe2+ transporters of the NRAMP family [Haloplanus vescus]